MKYLTTIIIALLFFSNTTAQEVDVQSFIEAYVDEKEMMGAIAISKSGEIVDHGAAGILSNAEGVEKKIQPDTRFRIGSISKVFTAVMIHQMVEKKQLTYEEKLSRFFPKVPNADQVSILQMLNHSSGIFSVTDLPAIGYIAYKPTERSTLLEMMEGTKPAFVPGAKNAYSNSNYMLLGFILEDLAGKSYGDLVQEMICKPLNLQNTHNGGKINNADNEASSFYLEGETYVAYPETDMSVPAGAGSMVSNVADLTKFIRGIFHGDLINKATLDKLIENKNDYGNGLFLLDVDGDQGYWHNGAIDGFKTMLTYFPETDVAVAILTNASRSVSVEGLTDPLYKSALGTALQKPDLKGVEVDTAILAKYVGDYTSDDLPLEIVIRENNGQLTAQATGQGALPLKAKSDTEYTFDPAGVVITFSDDGTFTLEQGGGTFRYKKK